jgi:hypothetical protein
VVSHWFLKEKMFHFALLKIHPSVIMVLSIKEFKKIVSCAQVYCYLWCTTNIQFCFPSFIFSLHLFFVFINILINFNNKIPNIQTTQNTHFNPPLAMVTTSKSLLSFSSFITERALYY